MVARYFHLRLGSLKVKGGVLKVDPAESDISRKVLDFFEEDHYRFRHVRSGIYELTIPNRRYANFAIPADQSGTRVNVPVPIDKGILALLRIEIIEDGKLRLVEQPQGKRAHLCEITESEARKLKEEKEYFDLTRAYVCE